MPASGWLAVGAAAAALLGGRVEPLIVALAAASIAVAARTSPGARHRTRLRRTPAIALAIGVAVVAIRLGVGPTAAPAQRELPAGDGPWQAAVVSVGAVRDGQQMATLAIRPHDPAAGDPLLVAATLPRYPPIRPGQAVRVDGTIRAPPAGPYGDYLARIGVSGTVRSRSLTLLMTDATPATWLESLRRGAGDALAAALPEPLAGLAAGILVGLRDRVDRDLAADFTTVGASHIVAISGWNIAIVAAAVAAAFGGLSRRRRAILTALAVTAYVLFAGASASVLRAAVMAGVVLLARESGRASRAAAALGWAALILLVLDPELIADAGFQLSTLATAGILAWATPLGARMGAAFEGRLPGWLVGTLAVGLAAQAATLPVVLATFGRLALVSPVVNLLVVPLVPAAMAAGIVAMAGGLLAMAGTPVALAALVGLPAWFLLSIITWIVTEAAGLPLAGVTLEPPFNVLLALLLVIGSPAVWLGRRASLGFHRERRRGDLKPAPQAPTREGRRVSRGRSRLAIAAIATIVATATVVVIQRPDGVARVTVIDVGQGDAVLVEGGRGGRLLVDGGPNPDRLLVELDARLPPWDRRLDALILTHPHEDHAAGMALLLERYRVGRVFEPGMRGPGPGYAALAMILAGRGDMGPGGAGSGRLATGDHLAVDDIRLTVLWPDRGTVPTQPPDSGRSINDVSIVLLGEVAGRRFLLSGDVEDDVDPRLLARGLPRVDLLKVAHHGSRTSSTDAFLDAVRPAVAVVSAGAGNPYGHPSPATLERIAARGTRVFRTDQDGSVEVELGRDRLAVQAGGGRPTSRRPSLTTGEKVAIAGGPVRAGFLCAIPQSPSEASEDRSAWPSPQTPTRLAVGFGRDGYHRLDVRPCPAGVFPGRRRLWARPGRRRLRGRPRDERPCGGSLADDGRHDERRTDRRAGRDGPDVRRRDRRHRLGPGGFAPNEGRARGPPGGLRLRGPGQRPRLRRADGGRRRPPERGVGGARGRDRGRRWRDP
jgi:competence protein ComEC